MEADQIQVNLTRFNLYYPEKREFFLEGYQNYQFYLICLSVIYHNNKVYEKIFNNRKEGKNKLFLLLVIIHFRKYKIITLIKMEIMFKNSSVHLGD